MVGLFYTVDLCANAEMARYNSGLVGRYLVELVCEKHRNNNCSQAACEIALQKFSAETVAITKHRVAERISPEIVLMNRSNPFHALCGSRYWSFPKLRGKV
jgi:hypothetical protein